MFDNWTLSRYSKTIYEINNWLFLANNCLSYWYIDKYILRVISRTHNIYIYILIGITLNQLVCFFSEKESIFTSEFHWSHSSVIIFDLFCSLTVWIIDNEKNLFRTIDVLITTFLLNALPKIFFHIIYVDASSSHTICCYIYIYRSSVDKYPYIYT